MLPAVVASPYGWAARSRAPSRAPPCTQARRWSGSTRTAPSGVRSTISPPSGTETPRTLWPPQRTPISRSRVRAKPTAAATSAELAQRAMTAGAGRPSRSKPAARCGSRPHQAAGPAPGTGGAAVPGPGCRRRSVGWPSGTPSPLVSPGAGVVLGRPASVGLQRPGGRRGGRRCRRARRADGLTRPPPAAKRRAAWRRGSGIGAQPVGFCLHTPGLRRSLGMSGW
jgi:hypothetical protein